MVDTITPTYQDTQLKNNAGLLVPSGTRPGVPQIALEGVADETVIANLAAINGMMPVMSDILFYDTRVFTNPLDPLFTKRNVPFGDYVEMAAFDGPAPSKKNDETKCMPFGNVQVENQFALSNYSYDISIDIKDREINKAVFNEAQKNRYVAEKMKTPLKQISVARYRAMVQIISDVIDMSRTLTSTDASDGTGSAVTYAMIASGTPHYGTIKGYAGKVKQFDLIAERVSRNSDVKLTGTGAAAGYDAAEEAFNFINGIQSAVRDMMIDARDYNKLEISTFCMTKPVAIFESKTLDALDATLVQKGEWKGFPTKSAREYLREFVDIVEIDSFGVLGDSASFQNYGDASATSVANATTRSGSEGSYVYTFGYRIGCVVLDRDACNEFITQETIEAFRCAKARSTGYNYQGENSFSVFRGVPSFAALVKVPYA